MPTYDYICDLKNGGCGNKFEKIQSFSDPVLTHCNQCGKNTLTRLFGTGSAIIFKSRGFQSVERHDNTLPKTNDLRERMDHVNQRNKEEDNK